MRYWDGGNHTVPLLSTYYNINTVLGRIKKRAVVVHAEGGSLFM